MEGHDEGLPAIERWWPHLSIRARHRVLDDLTGPLDELVVAEIVAITGASAPDRLTEAEQRFVLTQIEAVD
ncbi:hypothetical protein PX701_09075 [Agromyces sp. H3Y2-19a]|jgi:hypothetical protein|uniref:hypothetical protein n=1 Tax=Agromyces TaxID=33877 RepID=UPI001E28A356|nr:MULTISPECIES: hypothetical protein [Agromyces]MCD5345072.1 hypothetical protein [Agromyces sp. S2-1-8]MDF0513770.1 hypothetical protein [Agromyces chromiiresistens]